MSAQHTGPTDVAASVARLYTYLDPSRRARMLAAMLPSLGPLALASIGSGVFARFLTRERWSEVPVTLDDVARVSSDTVQVLTRYVEQSDASVLERVCSMLVDQCASGPALTVAAVALAVHVIRQRAVRDQAS